MLCLLLWLCEWLGVWCVDCCGFVMVFKIFDKIVADVGESSLSREFCWFLLLVFVKYFKLVWMIGVFKKLCVEFCDNCCLFVDFKFCWRCVSFSFVRFRLFKFGFFRFVCVILLNIFCISVLNFFSVNILRLLFVFDVLIVFLMYRVYMFEV